MFFYRMNFFYRTEFFQKGHKYFFANKVFSEKKYSFCKIHTYFVLKNVINFRRVLLHLNNHSYQQFPVIKKENIISVADKNI